jgi:hypothetical protein
MSQNRGGGMRGMYVHSNIMATAISSMRTWWYPSHGINPAIAVSWCLQMESAQYVLCMPTANLVFAIANVRVSSSLLYSSESPAAPEGPGEMCVWNVDANDAVVSSVGMCGGGGKWADGVAESRKI